jgi:hypothetical protein
MGAHVGITDRYRVIWKVIDLDPGDDLATIVVIRANRRRDVRGRSLYGT